MFIRNYNTDMNYMENVHFIDVNLLKIFVLSSALCKNKSCNFSLDWICCDGTERLTPCHFDS